MLTVRHGGWKSRTRSDRTDTVLVVSFAFIVIPSVIPWSEHCVRPTYNRQRNPPLSSLSARNPGILRDYFERVMRIMLQVMLPML
jgi:hypothetical protein